MTIINSVIKGKQPVIDTLNVTPSTSPQQITAPQGTDGYSPVNVSAVTSSIDANIVAGNIKKDVQILGETYNPYLLFTNSFDKSSSIKVCFTPIRVMCQNTIAYAMKKAINNCDADFPVLKWKRNFVDLVKKIEDNYITR